mmetsp:Transcript_83859/g.186218  ORF Transcript_83859/g.186218 Transcript_83859/m.186218 type:complete len:372 (-) Transcript_83859:2687-3802(-)
MALCWPPSETTRRSPPAPSAGCRRSRRSRRWGVALRCCGVIVRLPAGARLPLLAGRLLRLAGRLTLLEPLLGSGGSSGRSSGRSSVRATCLRSSPAGRGGLKSSAPATCPCSPAAGRGGGGSSVRATCPRSPAAGHEGVGSSLRATCPRSLAAGRRGVAGSVRATLPRLPHNLIRSIPPLLISSISLKELPRRPFTSTMRSPGRTSRCGCAKFQASTNPPELMDSTRMVALSVRSTPMPSSARSALTMLMQYSSISSASTTGLAGLAQASGFTAAAMTSGAAGAAGRASGARRVGRGSAMVASLSRPPAGLPPLLPGTPPPGATNGVPIVDDASSRMRSKPMLALFRPSTKRSAALAVARANTRSAPAATM